MREIKFRAWNGKDKMLDIGCAVDHYISYWKVMQFTGHKDKDKKEIYIGDILNWDNECTILIKEKDELGFYYEVLTQKDKNIVSFDIRFYRSEESAEVIGNIYENPELLSDAKVLKGEVENE